MSFRYNRLIIASSIALVSGVMGGALAAAVTTPDHVSYGDWRTWACWEPYARMLLTFAVCNFVLGLLPGLCAHILLVRLRLTGASPYLVTAALIGMFWCAVLGVSVTGFSYILASSLVGTACFWLVRRPDKGGEPRRGLETSVAA